MPIVIAGFSSTSETFNRANFFTATSSNFTICGWIKTPSNLTLTSYINIFGMESQMIADIFNNGGTVRWSIGTTSSDFVGSNTPTFSTWYHAAFVRDGDDKRLYIDGVLEVSGNDAVVGSRTLAIGHYNFTTSEKWGPNGHFAYVKIWESVLTIEEIQQEMMQGSPIKSGVKAFYPFYNISDETIDYSGNGNTLSAVGTATIVPAANATDGPPTPYNRGRAKIFIPVSSVVLQYASPESDITVGNWTTAPLYAKIDETVADNADFISSPAVPSNETCEVKLQAMSTPSARTSHALRYRYRKDSNSGTINLTVGLYQGTTLIASQSHNGVGTTWVDGVLTLTEEEANNISDYSNLRIRFTANSV